MSETDVVKYGESQEYIQKQLLQQDPIRFIQEFERKHRPQVGNLEPCFKLTDAIGLSRGEVYRALKNKFHSSLLEKLPSLSLEMKRTLLETSLKYLSTPDLQEIPMYLLENLALTDNLPNETFERLMEFPMETIMKIPIQVRRKAWEKNLQSFEVYSNSIIDEYLKDLRVIKISDDMSLALDTGKKRAKIGSLLSIKEALGDSVILFDFFTSLIRKRFASTGDLLLCSLLTDVLMSITKPMLDLDVAHLVDKLKEKHSKEFIVLKESSLVDRDKEIEIFTSLTSVIDELYKGVIAARDGVIKEKKRKLVTSLSSSSLSSLASKKTRTMRADEAAKEILRKLKTNFKEFAKPVVELYPGLKDMYLASTPHPMDFEKMGKKYYKSLAEVEDDLELIVNNCLKFNSTNPVICARAGELTVKSKNLINEYIGMVIEDVSNEKEEEEKNFASSKMNEQKIINQIVSLKAANAVMVLAEPNTKHSLAKMLWDILFLKVYSERFLPREVPSVVIMIWLFRLAENSQEIVQKFLNQEVDDVLNRQVMLPSSSDAINYSIIDDFILRPLPLLTGLIIEKDNPNLILDERLIQHLSSSELCRELYLRFICSRVRSGEEKFVLQLLSHVTVEIFNHPGFRRALSSNLERVSELGYVRRFCMDIIFLPYLKSCQEEGRGEEQICDAHEFFSAVLACDKSMKLLSFDDTRQFGDVNVMLEYARQGLSGMTHAMYTLPRFKAARTNYEKFFANQAFSSFRDSFNLPSMKGLGMTSPGSAKNSPSPGTYPMSASPGASYLKQVASPSNSAFNIARTTSTSSRGFGSPAD